MGYPLDMGVITKGLVCLGIGLIAFLTFSRSHAASAPISVEHTGTSQVGRFLAHEVKQTIAASQTLGLGDEADEGWELILITSEKESATFYSVVLVRKQFEDVFDQYVIAFHGTCTAEQLQQCAREIVNKVEEPAVQFEANWRDQLVAEGRAEK